MWTPLIFVSRTRESVLSIRWSTVSGFESTERMPEVLVAGSHRMGDFSVCWCLLVECQTSLSRFKQSINCLFVRQTKKKKNVLYWDYISTTGQDFTVPGGAVPTSYYCYRKCAIQTFNVKYTTTRKGACVLF